MIWSIYACIWRGYRAIWLAVVPTVEYVEKKPLSVFSQDIPMNAVVIEKIVDILHKEGYLGIRKLKYQDKVYVIDAFNDQSLVLVDQYF